MRFLMLGAGAIGGYFGGRLLEGGADVSFLVRERRALQLRRTGLKIRSTFGDFQSPVSAYSEDEASGKDWDVVLVACKAYDLASAMATLGKVVGPNTVILPLLNGLAHIEILNEKFGSGRVLGGLAKIAATVSPEGDIVHLNDWRTITFGEQDGAISDRVAKIGDAFSKTSVLAKVVPNIMFTMWEKFVHLSTVAGMTTLMRSSVGEIARASGGTELLSEFLARNADIAAREGFKMKPEFFLEFNTLFADTASTYKASMLRDIERNGAIEADHILGSLLSFARKHAIDDTMHRLVYTNLKAYEARREMATTS